VNRSSPELDIEGHRVSGEIAVPFGGCNPVLRLDR